MFTQDHVPTERDLALVRESFDKVVPMGLGEAKLLVESLGGAHHLSGIVDPGQLHDPLDVRTARFAVEVVKVLSGDVPLLQQLAGGPAL